MSPSETIGMLGREMALTSTILCSYVAVARPLTSALINRTLKATIRSLKEQARQGERWQWALHRARVFAINGLPFVEQCCSRSWSRYVDDIFPIDTSEHDLARSLLLAPTHTQA